MYLISYGRYLNNGGTPEGWMRLTPDDLLIMDIVHYTEKLRDQKQSSILIANAIGKLLSGNKGGE